jgi:hypothetical protein
MVCLLKDFSGAVVSHSWNRFQYELYSLSFRSSVSDFMQPPTYLLLSVCEYIYVFINASMYTAVCVSWVFILCICYGKTK